MDLHSYLQKIVKQSLSLFQGWGFSAHWASILNVALHCIVAVVIAVTLRIILKRLLRTVLIYAIRKRDSQVLHSILENKVAHYVSILVPVMVFYEGISIVFEDFPALSALLITLCDIYFVLTIIWIAVVLTKVGADLIKTKPAFRDKPIDSYVQVMRILLYIVGVVALFSNLTGKSPVAFFTAMGAISAVLLLMFKDVIMGMVASIQITTNDMLRIGDWITMPKYGADGDVLAINLTTVKVQNFDKTITTIPTYALISDSFQNWRGMRQSGGRRIKRALMIKQSSIRFIKEDELEYFRQIELVTSYIDHRQKDINKHNARNKVNKACLINGRNLTNAGLFRKYIEVYLQRNTGTNKNMHIMVRQLAPSEHGLPIEIYTFSNSVVWNEYEHIMADIFDHVIAAAPFFKLQIFELEGAGDTKRIEMLNQQ
jgi:miniconductance mechanosensitive channel